MTRKMVNLDTSLKDTFGINPGDECTADTVSVFGNEENIRVLLENLLGNALRYTPAGGKVNLHVSAKNGSAIVAMQDSGIGIIEGERERIFERFYRVLGTEVEGTGLGLPLPRTSPSSMAVR